MKCSNCLHYEQVDSLHGKCNSDKFIGGYRLKFVDYSSTDNNDTVRPNEVLIENDEGWCFLVGKDFGCIHFKTK